MFQCLHQYHSNLIQSCSIWSKVLIEKKSSDLDISRYEKGWAVGGDEYWEPLYHDRYGPKVIGQMTVLPLFFVAITNFTLLKYLPDNMIRDQLLDTLRALNELLSRDGLVWFQLAGSRYKYTIKPLPKVYSQMHMNVLYRVREWLLLQLTSNDGYRLNPSEKKQWTALIVNDLHHVSSLRAVERSYQQVTRKLVYTQPDHTRTFYHLKQRLFSSSQRKSETAQIIDDIYENKKRELLETTGLY